MGGREDEGEGGREGGRMGGWEGGSEGWGGRERREGGRGEGGMEEGVRTEGGDYVLYLHRWSLLLDKVAAYPSSTSPHPGCP